MFALRLINGFVFGISHESYPDVDAWLISVNIAFVEIMFGRNLHHIFDVE